jgi:hypothetical protein
MSSGVGTAEAPQQNLANVHAEELLQQTVDVERFEAVPEHDGNLQRLIERYGDNPGSCPYIKSMGEAGIQLVQKLAEAEKNPDRGPTIRELMDAKKKEAKSQTTDHDKPKATKDTETISTTKTERDTGKKPDELVHIDKPAENILRQHTIEQTDRKRAEIEQIHNQIIAPSETGSDPTIIYTPTIEKPTSIADLPEAERPDSPISEFTEQGIDPETIEDSTSSLIEASGENDDLALDVEAIDIDEPLFDIDEVMAELGLDYSYSEIGKVIEDTELVSEVDTSQADIEQAELGDETLIDDIRLDLAPDVAIDLRQPVRETIDPVLAEEAKPNELRIELSTYIETLEPAKAEAAEEILQTLVKVLEVNQIAIENGEEISEVDVKNIEHLFVELLESLNLDYQDETVKQLMQNLFSPEMIAEITEDYELSIDQLNYLGTREYKSTSVSTLLTSLVQMIKQKVEYHLRLGKYALSASLA